MRSEGRSCLAYFKVCYNLQIDAVKSENLEYISKTYGWVENLNYWITRQSLYDTKVFKPMLNMFKINTMCNCWTQQFGYQIY